MVYNFVQLTPRGNFEIPQLGCKKIVRKFSNFFFFIQDIIWVYIRWKNAQTEQLKTTIMHDANNYIANKKFPFKVLIKQTKPIC